MHPKLHSCHLSRRAVIYVRQSTVAQVHGNLESQRRQYALSERARTMGFAEVEVIDDDLGRSASGTQARPGFERLVALVLSGEVGAVFCIEASRLARNGRDWHHLLDLCALTDTQIADPDGIYDPKNSNDRLLLGLKGSVSEFELSLLRQRSQEAIVQKARRGELRFLLPVGLEWTRDGRIVLDPDLRVQQALRLVFRTFTERGSVRQVLKEFFKHGLKLPCAQRGPHPGERTVFNAATYSALFCILKNPLYAGAYAFGKSESRTRVVDGRARKSDGHKKPQEQWTVLLLDHHPGYISWPEYLRNQQMIREQAHGTRPAERKAGRGGGALLSGMVRCRRCGRRMLVHYRGSQKERWSYVCSGEQAALRTTRCLYLGGYKVDTLVSSELLRALSPCAIQAAYKAAQTQVQAAAGLVQAVELELVQAQYQVDLEARRYQEVDPQNRLVALELERRWEAGLCRVGDLERRLASMQAEPPMPEPPSLEQLLALGSDLPAVWNAPEADMGLKQRLVRLLIHEVLCDIDRDLHQVVLVLHWQGGRHSELRLPLPVQGHNRCRASEQAAAMLAEHGDRLSADKLAKRLNLRGLHTGHGHPWTATSVQAYLTKHRLGRYGRPLPSTKGLTLVETARRLKVSVASVRHLIDCGLLPMTQRFFHCPFHIPAEALDHPDVQAAARSIHSDPRSRLSKEQKHSQRQKVINDSEGA